MFVFRKIWRALFSWNTRFEIPLFLITDEMWSWPLLNCKFYKCLQYFQIPYSINWVTWTNKTSTKCFFLFAFCSFLWNQLNACVSSAWMLKITKNDAQHVLQIFFLLVATMRRNTVDSKYLSVFGPNAEKYEPE